MQIPKNKTRCDAALKSVLKLTRAGSNVSEDIAKELKVLLNYTTYRSLLQVPNSSLRVEYVTYSGGHRKKSLVILMPDGNVIPLSKKKILEQVYGKAKRRSTTLPPQLMAALRREISPQITAFKEATKAYNPDAVCPYLGIPLSKCPTAVDHVKPFIDLVKEFAAAKQLDWKTVQCAGRGTNKTLADRELAEEWAEYHLEYAELELISQEANLKKGSGSLERMVLS